MKEMFAARTRSPIALLAVASMALGFGCDKFKEQPAEPFEVMVRVESDPNAPLPGAKIVRNGQDVTATGEDGSVKLAINGREGDIYDYFVKCPPEYESPQKPISVALRRVADKKKLPEYDIRCPPTLRRIVVAIRADHGEGLPVTYLGKEVARTDGAGAAHVLMAMKPGDQFELALDTAQNDRLVPQNPSAAFVVKDEDEIQNFDVKFKVKPKPSTHHWKPRARPMKL